MFLEISKKSQENTFARVSILIKLQAWLWHSCFPVNFAKFLRTPFLQNTSGWLLLSTGIFKYFVNCLVTSISRNLFLCLLPPFISSIYFFCSKTVGLLQKFPNVLPRMSKLFVRPHLDHRGILDKGNNFVLHQKLQQFQCNACNHRYQKGNFQ